MAKKIGTLYAVLGLNGAQFDKGMKNATRSLKKFGRDTKKISMQFGKYFAVGAAAATTALVAMTKSAMATADEVGKMADRINMSTEDLIGFQYAAKITGTDTEIMNRALEKMSINLGKSAMGTGAAAASLKKMGLDVNDIVKMNAGEQFKAISEGLKTLGTRAEQAAVASEIFGRSGARMLNLLAGSKGTIAELVEEAKKLGITLSRVEIKQIENANDALARLHLVFGVIGNRLATYFAPAIAMVSERLIDAANSGTGFKDKVDTAIKVVFEKFASLIKLVSGVTLAFKSLQLGFMGIKLTFITVTKAIYKAFATSWGLIIKGFSMLAIKAGEYALKIELAFKKAAQNSAKDFGWFIGRVIAGSLDKSIDKTEAKIKEVEGVFESLKNTKAVDIFEMGTGLKMLEFGNFKQAEAIKQVKKLSDEMANLYGMAFGEAGDKWTEDLKKRWDVLRTESEKLAKSQVDEWNKIQEGMTNTTETGFKKMSDQTKKWADELSGKFATLMQEGQFTFKSIGAAIRDMALQQVFTKASSGIVGTLLNIGSAIGSGAKNQAGATATMTGGSGGVGSGGYGTPSIIQHLSFGEGVNEASRAAVVSMMPSIQGATAAGVRDAAARRGG